MLFELINGEAYNVNTSLLIDWQIIDLIKIVCQYEALVSWVKLNSSNGQGWGPVSLISTRNAIEIHYSGSKV